MPIFYSLWLCNTTKDQGGSAGGAGFRYLHCSSSGQRSPLQTGFGSRWRCIPGPLGMGALGARLFPAAQSSWWEAERNTGEKQVYTQRGSCPALPSGFTSSCTPRSGTLRGLSPVIRTKTQTWLPPLHKLRESVLKPTLATDISFAVFFVKQLQVVELFQ